MFCALSLSYSFLVSIRLSVVFFLKETFKFYFIFDFRERRREGEREGEKHRRVKEKHQLCSVCAPMED